MDLSDLTDLSLSFVSNFDSLKISALTKYKRLNGCLNEVTIGPNSSFNINDALTNEITDKIMPTLKMESTSKKPRLSNENINPCRQVLQELDKERLDQVEEVVNERWKLFNDFTKQAKETNFQQWERQKQHILNETQEQEQHILQEMEQYDLNKSKQNEELIKHYQEMLQKKQQYEEQLERSRQKQKILRESIEKINKCQIDFRTTFQKLLTTIRTYPELEQLKKNFGDSFQLLRQLPEQMDELITKCKGLDIKEAQVTRAQEIVAELKVFKTDVDIFIAEEIDRKQKAQAAAEKLETETAKKAEEAAKNFKLEQCISSTNLVKYSAIKQFFFEYSHMFKALVDDDTMKQFRFDCKKAINIPVNGITGVSAQHLKDKYMKLFNLLSGKNVLVGDKQFNATAHPQGIAYCLDLLAKKFVLQSDLMISSNPDAAFSYATVIVTLWNNFPTFGQLLLGYFYTQCPYLIPFNIPQSENQSDDEYYRSLGYAYINGQIEKQDKFLDRMTGIMRLYFTILIAKPSRTSGKNPHNIANGWKYFVSLLKLEPQMDITATALRSFLETVGFAMDEAYGKEFKRLLALLSANYMSNLKKKDAGGPVSRLEVLLQDYKSKGRFERPRGLLPPNFW